MRKPIVTAFTQQNLKTWKPVITPKCMIPTCFTLGILLLSIGIVLVIVSNQVVSYSIPYDGQCKNETVCNIAIKIDKKMVKPVFVYYRLTGFYQNSKVYVKSVSMTQLKGDTDTKSLKESCYPFSSPSKSGSPVYYPCGMIANSYFNGRSFMIPVQTSINDAALYLDNYKDFKNPDGKDIAITDKGITWASDSQIFKPTPYDDDAWVPPPAWNADLTLQEVQDIVTSRRFQVWMRPAGFPDFKKLWGRIDEDLKPGTYTITVENNYNVDYPGGTKSIVFSTLSFMGGKTVFLSTMYIVFGTIFIILGFTFLYQNLRFPRRLGDPAYLSWRQPPK